MTARARHVAAFLDRLSQPGPEARWLSQQSEALARIRAEREAERTAEHLVDLREGVL